MFVMEEEYRMQKAQSDMKANMNGKGSSSSPVIHEDGTVTGGNRDSTLSGATTKVDGDGGADDDASTKGVVSPADPSQADLTASEIPTIKISTESDREREHADMEAAEAKLNGENTTETPKNGTSTMDDHDHGVEKPIQAASGDGNDKQDDSNPAQDGFSFSNKRLCERWLDNLFMVLYEVCRTRDPLS